MTIFTSLIGHLRNQVGSKRNNQFTSRL